MSLKCYVNLIYHAILWTFLSLDSDTIKVNILHSPAIYLILSKSSISTGFIVELCPMWDLATENIRVAFKPRVTLRQYLIHLKHPAPWNDKCGATYHIPCHEYEQVYIGETGRPPQKGLPVGYYTLNISHGMEWNNMGILSSKMKWLPRTIKEAV